MSRVSVPLTFRASAIDSASRPSVSARGKPSGPAQPEMKPAQVHDLKLQTQQIQQQIRVLGSQLKRIEGQIASHTASINKTFGGHIDASQKNVHEHSVRNLRRHIEGAHNTLHTLAEQIDLVTNDDRTSTVEELEEELKMSWCEFQRLSQLLQKRHDDSDFAARGLMAAEFRASTEHLTQSRTQVRALRAENASLKDKSLSYQTKLEKIQVEKQILECLTVHREMSVVADEVELEQTELNGKMNRLTDSLNTERQSHQQNVRELKQIIESMRQKIASNLEARKINASEAK
jgi:hypothetical protein